MSKGYIEEDLPIGVRDLHRALVSLQEELEAIDKYNQRAVRSDDGELKSILIHNRNEEIEHATRLLEYLRQTVPEFDANMKLYLFAAKPATEIEVASTTPLAISDSQR